MVSGSKYLKTGSNFTKMQTFYPIGPLIRLLEYSITTSGALSMKFHYFISIKVEKQIL